MLTTATHRASLCALAQQRSTPDLSLVLDWPFSSSTSRRHGRHRRAHASSLSAAASPSLLHTRSYRLSDRLDARLSAARKGRRRRGDEDEDEDEGDDDRERAEASTSPARAQKPPTPVSSAPKFPTSSHPRPLRPLLFAPNFTSSFLGSTSSLSPPVSSDAPSPSPSSASASTDPLSFPLPPTPPSAPPGALYIKNLPPHVSRFELLGAFQPFGKIEYVYSAQNGTAYVRYEDAGAVKRALIRYAEGSIWVAGREVIVYRALDDKESMGEEESREATRTDEKDLIKDSTPEAVTGDTLPAQIPTVVIPRFIDDHPPSADLFLGNLPFSVNKPLLRQFWNRYGTVIDVRVAYDAQGNCAGYAHVEFASVEDALSALLSGARRGFVYGDRALRVGFGQGGGPPVHGAGNGGRRGILYEGTAERAPRVPIRSKTVYVHQWRGNDAVLRDRFRNCRGFAGVFVEPPIRGKPWRAAFVQFVDIYSAERAIVNARRDARRDAGAPALEMQVMRLPSMLRTPAFVVEDTDAFRLGPRVEGAEDDGGGRGRGKGRGKNASKDEGGGGARKEVGVDPWNRATRVRIVPDEEEERQELEEAIARRAPGAAPVSAGGAARAGRGGGVQERRWGVGEEAWGLKTQPQVGGERRDAAHEDEHKEDDAHGRADEGADDAEGARGGRRAGVFARDAPPATSATPWEADADAYEEAAARHAVRRQEERRRERRRETERAMPRAFGLRATDKADDERDRARRGWDGRPGRVREPEPEVDEVGFGWKKDAGGLQ